jgi:hypothetical protein
MLGMSNVPTTKTCHHETRVYSGECLGTFNDVPHHQGTPMVSWYWICPDCLEVGTDFFEASFKPHTEPKRYWRAMREREPGCNVPQAYRY